MRGMFNLMLFAGEGEKKAARAGLWSDV